MQPDFIIDTGLTGNEEPSAGKPDRLSDLFTSFVIETKGRVALNLTNQNTLALSLPELLRRAKEEADQILLEETTEP